MSENPAETPIVEKKERNFKITLMFDGTNYHGWQRQPNGITVQEILEDRLFKLFGRTPVRVQGSSRTDAGVHALGMVGSFRAPESPYIPDDRLLRSLNKLLPEDIRIRSLEQVDDSFNARFSAEGKSYVYIIDTGTAEPFTSRWSWNLPDLTNHDGVRQALTYFVGEHDFKSYAVEAANRDDTVRKIIRAELYECGPLKMIHFIGTGFLYKMVRSMVGAIAEVGRNRLAPERIGEILEEKKRTPGRDTAPARGLFLVKVFYEPDEWVNYEMRQVPFAMRWSSEKGNF